jgi:uncharacterized LabA/DUF88 family protein
MKEKTLIFIDGNFLKLISKKFGIKYDINLLFENIVKELNLEIEKILYYDAPPYISNSPSDKEKKLSKNFSKFKWMLEKNKIEVKLGKCQKITDLTGKTIFKQKRVDTLLSNDLVYTPIDFPKIKKVILVACDSDFIPSIQKIEEKGVETILYSYYEKNKNTNFSGYNHLFKVVKKSYLFKKEDFEKSSFE